MNIITLDFESFYSDDYTLSKMTTESYVRDPRFEAHGCAIRFPTTETTTWWDHDELKTVFADIDWANTTCLAHHAQFDGLILSHHYGVKPKFWFDTLSMARLLLGNHLSVGLDALAKHFGMSAKTVPYNLFKGKHWRELDPTTQKQVADGACHDVELTWNLFKTLAKDFPREEYAVVDETIKMFTQPVLRGDIDMLGKIWLSEEQSKATRLKNLIVREADLQSADRFDELLRAEGVEPEMKNGKKKQIYAFAKTDQFMRDLLEDDNDRVRTLAEARLGAKSTIMQTRAETLGWMASRGPMPVYLRYAGAHTTRDSGGDGANWQNFKRVDPDNPNQASPLRRAIMAPEGFLLAPVDLSQIECRLLNYLAGQEDVLENFRAGRDPYIGIASQFYGRAITKADKEERGTGKQAELSCGFGCADKKFQATAKLGIYGPPVYLTIEQARKMVNLYRETHPAICAKGIGYWSQASRLIPRLAGGEPVQWGPMNIKDKRVYGPGGTMLLYDTLEYYTPTPDECEDLPEFKWDGYWRFRTRNGWTDLYHTKFVENVIQWLARIVMMQAMLRIRALEFRIVMRTHDELVVLIPKDGREQQHLETCMAEMRREPTWLPGIPLDCEGSLGERYAK